MRKPRTLTWWSGRPRSSSSAVVAPAAQVAGAVEPGAGLVRRTDRARSARPSSSAPVEVAEGDAGAADVELARHADRAGLAVGVEDQHLTCWRWAGRSRCPARGACTCQPWTRPSSRSGRTCSTARPCASSSCSASTGGSDSPPISARKPAAPRPAGLDQRAPGRGRGLHHGDRVALEQRAQRAPDRAPAAARRSPPGPDRQRQQQVQHRDVEGQGGDRQQAVVGRAGPASCAMLARKLTTAAVRHPHALGLAGGARGVDQVGRVQRPGVAARRRAPGLARGAGDGGRVVVGSTSSARGQSFQGARRAPAAPGRQSARPSAP